MRIIVTGGGSSGHISPALAVIAELQAQAAAQDIHLEVRYIGSRQGLEEGLVTAAGIPFSGVVTGKLRRYFSLQNFIDPFRVPLGVLQAWRLVRAFHPQVVFSTGGYVAVPTVLAAWLCRVPILIHEQTVQLGLANRITARCATRIALSFASALHELPRGLQSRAVVTGNPVRAMLLEGDPEIGRQWAGFPSTSGPVVYVTGGSQGSRLVNRAVADVLTGLLQHCCLIHQCGLADLDALKQQAAALDPSLQVRYRLEPFLRDELRHVLALADLVVGRAGAGTVAELCLLGKPALYIPLVPTGGDEQTRNAQMCVDQGAARLLPQTELSGQSLFGHITELLGDPAQLERLGEAARSLARPHATRDLAALLLEMARS